ncbi:carbohydrate ABC transporter permease [Allosediminivita pacifica]|uniref:Carbohydrate ABC transporter membrane protein 2 (CUT1 family) n=1 Tax=Allosediminivita pacifica TaxID=1267769 RepID=A0A2T6AJ11_9RHOB|nr:carbohydrate ABC transporter permease [Allosediminivita pacifica]PTX43809.1 carbohydrate ABC transporter membrane protein 2 (CUT1 family) [Allosediminivita pacifica]GGB21962.1 sugar ABC transporter permease [Allosediminivita pacifica]
MALHKPSTMRRILTVDLPMLAILAFTLGPYLWMFITSVSDESTLFTEGPSLLNATLENYARLFRTVGFADNLLDSFIVAGGTVIVGLSLSVTAAYSFSRFEFRGKRILMLQFLLINMFPLVLLILPLFVLMRVLGLLDTHIALIAANSTIAIPFSIWMMVSYINGIPRSLDEAAMTDGCTRLQALRRVVLPLCLPGIIATGIYIFITSWNEYLYALTLGGREVRPITVAVQTLIGEYEVQWGLLTAGGIVGALPATVLFLLVQKRLISGLTQGAVKG